MSGIEVATAALLIAALAVLGSGAITHGIFIQRAATRPTKNAS